MGRDLLSVTGLAQKILDDLRPILEVLPLSDRRIVEGFFEVILQERVAIASASDLLPLEAAFVILLVAAHKRMNRENSELEREIQELRDKLLNSKRDP
jgi:hypothetical protein